MKKYYSAGQSYHMVDCKGFHSESRANHERRMENFRAGAFFILIMSLIVVIGAVGDLSVDAMDVPMYAATELYQGEENDQLY